MSDLRSFVVFLLGIVGGGLVGMCVALFVGTLMPTLGVIGGFVLGYGMTCVGAVCGAILVVRPWAD